MYFKARYRLAVFGVSLAVALLLMLSMIQSGQLSIQPPYYIPVDMRINFALMFCVLIAITPSAIIEIFNTRWLKQVDKNIPRLLMDVTESLRSGMPMVRALELASQRDFGPISRNLEKAMVNFNFTSDLDGSLTWFGNSLVRPSGKRAATILIEATKSGGRMLDVMDTSINMFTAIDEYREEKESQISPYIILVYASTLIFLLIGYVVIAHFLVPLGTSTIDKPGIPSIMGKTLSIEYYKSIIFWAAVVEGILGGLVAGKISNSRIASGLIHSALLIAITYGFYVLILV